MFFYFCFLVFFPILPLFYKAIKRIHKKKPDETSGFVGLVAVKRMNEKMSI